MAEAENAARPKRKNPTTDAILVLDAMERLNMNQSQLAAALGYSSGGAVSGWIKCGQMPLVAARALEALYAQAIKPPGQNIPPANQVQQAQRYAALVPGQAPKPTTAIGGGRTIEFKGYGNPGATPPEEDADMDAHQATVFLANMGVAVGAKTLRNARQRGNGPAFRKVYNRAIYKRSDLIAWAKTPRPRAECQLPGRPKPDTITEVKSIPAPEQTVTIGGKTYRLVQQ